MNFKRSLIAAAAVLLTSASTVVLTSCATDGKQTASAEAPSARGELVSMRRLTAAQYERSVADIFGKDIDLTGRFETEVRVEGLNTVGAANASISAGGLEQYYAMAASIGEQALAPKARDKTMPCKPASAKAPDDACATAFLTKYGRLAFRRPLTAEELSSRVALARRVAEQRSDFYSGLQEALTSVLASPNFLFRVERALPGKHRGDRPLDAYARASRLSFMFWNSTPDDELLTAAESGALMTKAGLQAQVDRLAASPRIADGVADFFDDAMMLDMFASQSKDPLTFPKYSGALAAAAREQTLKTIVDLLVTKNGDYRDIFTSNDTFLTRELAMVYKVPFGVGRGWAPYTFAESEGRSGVLTQISFLSLFSHPARSSPTKRGVALNEVFLCQTTPSPPGDVDFSLINEPNPLLKTLRSKLTAHATEPSCAGCHTLVDPPGLALEGFDSLGERRSYDNGELIDVTSEWQGKKFSGAVGLGRLLHDDARAPQCITKKLYASAAGRVIHEDDPALKDLTAQFTRGGYRIPAFLKVLAADDRLYKVPAARPAEQQPAAPTKVAARNGASS